MEPMMPRVTPELISLSGAIRERIGGLKEKLHPITAKAVSAVVADMNSYYSNLIEGHHTYPKDIENAPCKTIFLRICKSGTSNF